MITGVVLARNEEANIGACLATLRPHVAEVILIDMDSDDRTVDSASPYCDKIFRHPLVAQFDPVRNLSIDHATHDWLWFVDADERIPSRTGLLVNELVRERGHTFESITIPFKTYFCGKWMQHCGWWPGYIAARVVKKGFFEWGSELHSGVRTSGRGLRIGPDPSLAIDHFSYKSIEHYCQKLNRYTTTEAAQLVNEAARVTWETPIRAMTRDLWLYYERNRGNQDGLHGWILSWLAGQYRWFSYAKLLDAAPADVDTTNVPKDLDHLLSVIQSELSICRKHGAEKPLGIVLSSPLYDPSGYADDGRMLAKLLARLDRHAVVRNIPWSDVKAPLPDQDAALLRALSRGARSKSTLAITDCIPTLCRPDPEACVNVLRTTFETNRIPSDWVEHIEQFDETWVMSEFNRRAFVHGGIAPERLRVLPGFLDTSIFHPGMSSRPLPTELQQRFVFFSVFDWQFRKGWDILLRAYCEEFAARESVGLLCKLTHTHVPSAVARQQAADLLRSIGFSLESRPDIVFQCDTLEASELAELYRSVDAFVLPSRGEGCGRSLMEAMASGLPTIGPNASGNLEFMNDSNAFLIPCTQVDVPDAALREVPHYAGHRWYEPDQTETRRLMRLVYSENGSARSKGQQAARDLANDFGIQAGKVRLQMFIEETENQWTVQTPPDVPPDAIRVELEGELFAGHSFSNINEWLSREFIKLSDIALSIRQRPSMTATERHAPRSRQLAAYVDRPLQGDPDVVIRHAFPPSWEPVQAGKWVHIQPWEYSAVPPEWLDHFANDVDEVWVPSQFNKQIYVAHGVDPTKVVVTPWGVDEEFFHVNAVPVRLPSEKSFHFLYVGGAIARKGCDLLLEAYLSEFSQNDDVGLVIKDVGSTTFYNQSNLHSRIEAAARSHDGPRLIHIDRSMTDGQLASLYGACDCFVAPYRGEGFGLPILEAMACGLPVIIPSGGPTDEYVSDEHGYILPSRPIRVDLSAWGITEPAFLKEIDVKELRAAMRAAYVNRDHTRQLGRAAALSVVTKKRTWGNTAKQMATRIRTLAGRDTPVAIGSRRGPVGFLETYASEFQPHLGRRGATFERLIRYLLGQEKSGLMIVETGCVRQQDDWSAGQSTLLFDRFVSHVGGRVVSVDISPVNCHHARQRVSSRTTVVNQDSVGFLSEFAAQHPGEIDCLYLDSLDVDWNNPAPSALHHLMELCAAIPGLHPESLVVVDDHRSAEGQVGKSCFVLEHMRRIGAQLLFEDQQIGWIFRSRPTSP